MTTSISHVHNRHQYGGYTKASELDRLFHDWSTLNNHALDIAFYDDNHAIWQREEAARKAWEAKMAEYEVLDAMQADYDDTIADFEIGTGRM